MSPTTETFIRVLNEAFAADPNAIHALFCARIPCNEALADHPTVRVSPAAPGIDGYNVGLLGVLNGILEPLTGDRVAFAWDDTNKDHPRPIGFRLYQHDP